MKFISTLLCATFLVLLSCEREISLYDIDGINEGNNYYQGELRIEGILFPTENMALVRIDKTFPLNENYIYDCLDNDGDWDPLTDDLGEDGQVNDPNDDDHDGITNEPSIGENNGIPDCGEPNVDEYDEVLPNFHVDSTICSSVKLYGPWGEYPFTWVDNAAQLISYPEYDPNLDEAITEWYGGWIPISEIDFGMSPDMPIEDRIYSLECDCGEFGVITATDTLLLPVNFYGDSLGITALYENIYNYPTILNLLQNCPVDNFWLTSSTGEAFSTRQIYFSSPLEATSFWVKVEEFSPDGINLDTCTPTNLNYIHAFPAMSTVEGMLNDNTYITGTVIAEIPGYYRINVQTMSHGFENYYFYTDLDLHDPVRSNLRKNDGSVAMGSFGALTTNSLYTIVQLPPMVYMDHLDVAGHLLYIGIETQINVNWFHIRISGANITGQIPGGEIADEDWNLIVSPSTGEISGQPQVDPILNGENILFAVIELDPASLVPGAVICMEDIGFAWTGHNFPYVVFYGPCITIE